MYKELNAIFIRFFSRIKMILKNFTKINRENLRISIIYFLKKKKKKSQNFFKKYYSGITLIKAISENYFLYDNEKNIDFVKI